MEKQEFLLSRRRVQPASGSDFEFLAPSFFTPRGSAIRLGTVASSGTLTVRPFIAPLIDGSGWDGPAASCFGRSLEFAGVQKVKDVFQGVVHSSGSFTD
jgi:hypothetical protein